MIEELATATPSRPARPRASSTTTSKDLHETVQNTFARIGQTVDTLGEALFNSGLADFFVQIGGAVESLLRLIGTLFGAFEKLNNRTKGFGLESGLLLPLAEFAVLAVGATKVLDLLSGSKVKDTAITAGNTAGEAANVVAKILAAAEASSVKAAALGKEAAAEEADTLATAANTGAEGAGGISRMGRLKQFGAQALSGGKLLNISQADTATKAAGLGTGAASMAVPLAGLAIGAGLLVNNVREGWADQLKGQEKTLKEQLEKADLKQLNALGDVRSDYWEGVASKLFGTELTEDLVRESKISKQAEPAAKKVSALAKGDNVKDFAQKVSDPNLKVIQDMLIQTPAMVDLAKELDVSEDELGFTDDEGKPIPLKRGRLRRCFPSWQCGPMRRPTV